MKTAIIIAMMLAQPFQTVSARPPIPPKSAGVEKAVRPSPARAYVGEPGVRIRKIDGGPDLGPFAFAKWLIANRRPHSVEPALLPEVSSAHDLPDRSADFFAMADSNGDRRVSASELADFMANDLSKGAAAGDSWAAKVSP